MGLFTDLFGGMQYPAVTENQMKALRQWLQGIPSKFGPSSGAGLEQSALTQMFKSAQDAISRGTPFYESLIPSSPGALSPAAAAEKSAATDALLSAGGSANVSGLGQLNREYGGRLPASQMESLIGNTARGVAGGQTDIARRAIGENINLGEQGVQGLAGLTSLGGVPLSQAAGMISMAPSGGYMDKGAIGKIGDAAKSIAGGIAGFAGLPGGGGNLSLQSGLNTIASNPSLYAPNRTYLPLGGG